MAPRFRTLHHGYEYADCAEADWISLSTIAEKIASNTIDTGMIVLRCMPPPTLPRLQKRVGGGLLAPVGCTPFAAASRRADGVL